MDTDVMTSWHQLPGAECRPECIRDLSQQALPTLAPPTLSVLTVPSSSDPDNEHYSSFQS